MDQQAYKKAVEERIANNAGTTFDEVLVIVGVAVLISVVADDCAGILRRRLKWWQSFPVECAVYVTTLLLTVCDLAPTKVVLPVLVGTAIIVRIVGLVTTDRSTSIPTTASQSDRKFFTVFRASLMLLTCFSILAVDFAVFPKRHMKTESFGISLMDTGVGCFVFSAAFAFGSKLANAKDRTGGTFSVKWLGSALPLLVIGGARFWIIWVTDYQEHVTEYGKHWNFFITLASLPVLYATGQKLLGLVPWPRFMTIPVVQATALLVSYQYALTNLGVSDFIMNDDRSTFFAANKEGIISTAGYLALFLFGVEAGLLLGAPVPRTFRAKPTGKKEGKEEWITLSPEQTEQLLRHKRTTQGLGATTLSMMLYGLTLAIDLFVQPSSRRMCNAAYVSFILCLCIGALGLLLLSGVVLPACRPSGDEAGLAAAVNANQFAVFLCANLSTGAINLSMQTIFQPTEVACIVIGGYLFWVCMLASFAFDGLHWRLKVW